MCIQSGFKWGRAFQIKGATYAKATTQTPTATETVHTMTNRYKRTDHEIATRYFGVTQA